MVRVSNGCPKPTVTRNLWSKSISSHLLLQVMVVMLIHTSSQLSYRFIVVIVNLVFSVCSVSNRSIPNYKRLMGCRLRSKLLVQSSIKVKVSCRSLIQLMFINYFRIGLGSKNNTNL